VNICLDLSAGVHHRAGIGRFSQELISALVTLDPTSHYSVFYNRPQDARPDPPTDRLPTLTVPWDDKPWRLRVLLSQMTGRSQDHLLPGIDLFHGMDHLLPRLARVPGVFTVYDLTYLLTDTHATLNRLFLTLMMPRFLRNADAIIAISESTKRDMLRHYKVDEAKVKVIYGGVTPRFRPAPPDEITQVRRRHSLPEHFILSVGTIEPRKNLVRLLEAYRSLRDRGNQLGLVIAGRRGWRCEDFFRRLQELGLTDEVILLGAFPDAELPALYSAADVFVFPSLYEGFGLPVLEAMACGTPVIASNTSAILEVVAENGILFNPYDDARGLAEAIAHVLDNAMLRDELCAKGLAQANRFTWQQTAEATLDVYRSVLQREMLG
jgi:glycosyltransferase involved in cell wall biosynthesis